MELTALLSKYAGQRIRFTDRSEREYRSTVTTFSRWLSRSATLADLTDDNLAAFLKWRVSNRSPSTARKDRQQLVTLWRWAWKKRLTEEQPRDIPEVVVPKKKVRAWSPSEVAAILSACDFAPAIDGWDHRFDKALTLTIYDSAERIRALLDCPFEALDVEARFLRIPGWCRKRDAGHDAGLHEQTIEAIVATLDGGPRERLFPWPRHYISLLRRFKRILKVAGISTEKRKVFHDLRRTSYSLCFGLLGKDAATRHAGHSQDLSHFYLDESLLPDRRVADILPRPA